MDSESEDMENPAPSTSCNAIRVSKTSNIDKRKWDKFHFCYFCQKKDTNMRRHYLNQHKQEEEVRAILAAQDRKTRVNLITKLRNLGDHMHNIEVLKSGAGELVVGYRPTLDGVGQAEDYVPCPMCLLYLVKDDLWRHKCPLATGGKKPSARDAKLLLPNAEGSDNEILTSIIATLRSDRIGRIIKSDQLILDVGRKLMSRHGHDRDRHSVLRENLRRLARLLEVLRCETDEINAGLKDFITPSKFCAVFNAVKCIAGYEEKTNTFKTPSLALKLGHSLKKCSTILHGQALERSDQDAVKNAVNFEKLMEVNWGELNAPAHRTLNESHKNKPKLLPLTEDVMRMSEFLKKRGQECLTALQKATREGFGSDAKACWMSLNEISLAYIILFNRRRVGEVSKMTVTRFEERAPPGGHPNIDACLTDVEKVLCQSFFRIEISGKRGRTVPVLLGKDVETWIKTLLLFRKGAGVNPENKYLFPIPKCYSTFHIRGSDILRRWSVMSGAQMPELLRSKALRRHVATMSQIIN